MEIEQVVIGTIKIIQSRRHIYNACNVCGKLRWIEFRRKDAICLECNTKRGVAREKRRGFERLGFETEETLLNKIRELHANLMSDQKIAEVLGVGRKAIEKRRVRMGLRAHPLQFVSRDYKERRNLSLSQDEHEVLTGLMLGDGSLSPIEHTACYIHNTSICETLEIIRQKLPSVSFSDIRQGINKGHYKSNGEYIRETVKFSINSRHYPLFLDWYSHWYGSGSKQVPQDIILSQKACYWWYIGDGCLPHRTGRPTDELLLCTHSFNDDSKTVLIQQMKSRIALRNVFIVKSGDMKGALSIYGDDIPKFLEYIGPCENPAYAYKWNYIKPSYYKNRMQDCELPKTRGEAIRIDCVAYFNGIQCKNGHVSRRSSKSDRCYQCANEQTMRWKTKKERQT